ncbi:MAG: polysaccharide biosynthesis C-terminal domain-containing protein [Candidatus Izimaplasma sp.]|nr:polysaccharide biosynthesis C-terminal domain-containing protein [Candidatus Izimaplasma bacterium]
MVDSIYAGQISTNALAGLGFSFPIFFLIISLSSGLGNGTTALTAISLGEDDKEKFHSYAYNAVIMSLLFGILLPILAFLTVRPLFELAGATGEVLEIGYDYTTTVFMGATFFALNFIFRGILYAEGKTKPYRNVLISGFFLNLILDPLFTFGWFGLPKLGVSGIAYATILSQVMGTIYLTNTLLKSESFDVKMFFEILFH